jgi:hypothetical protein
MIKCPKVDRLQSLIKKQSPLQYFVMFIVDCQGLQQIERIQHATSTHTHTPYHTKCFDQ